LLCRHHSGKHWLLNLLILQCGNVLRCLSELVHRLWRRILSGEFKPRELRELPDWITAEHYRFSDIKPLCGLHCWDVRCDHWHLDLRFVCPGEVYRRIERKRVQ